MKQSIALLLMLILTFIVTGQTSECKMKKVYLGKYYVSTYHASDNTPRGSRSTSSGARATEGWTVAVDYRNPLVPMGSIVHIEGFGKLKVQDYGGFGRYNGGLRQFDVFMPEGQGGLFYKKCWFYRPETKKEKEKRLAKKRKKRQEKPFVPVYNGDMDENIIYADPAYIKGGTVQIGIRFYDVKPLKTLKNRILINNETLVRWNSEIIIDGVIEKARG